jgi:hypothetical protein
MSRATFTNVSFDPPEAGAWIDATTEKRGFRLTGSATVTATLENAPYQFSWCAYAIGVPPNAKLASNGSYTLLGTPPFTINENITVDGFDFGPGTCITSITDFTYNPDGFFPPPPEVTVTASETEVCAGMEVTFTATATGGTTTAMNYTWSIAGTETTTTTNACTTALVDAGKATCTVFVTNANGCTSTISPAGTVTVNVVPVVHNVSSETICSGMSATLIADVSGMTTPATYTWIIDGAARTTTTNTYTTPVLTATATYTVQITNNTSCTSAVSDAGTITVNPLPAITVTGVPENPLSGDQLTLTASGAGDGGSYCFSFECEPCLYNPFETGLDLSAAADCRWHSECTYTETNTFPLTLPEGEMTLWVRAMTAEGCVDSLFRIINTYGADENSGAGTITTQTVTAIQGYIPQVKEPKSEQPAQRAEATYEWRREGWNRAPLTNANAPDYDMVDDAEIVNTPGTYIYRRYASGRYADGDAPIPATGVYTLVVVAPPPSPSGTTTWLNTDTKIIWTDAVRSTTTCDPDLVKDRGVDYGLYYKGACWASQYSTICTTPWRQPSNTTFPNQEWFGLSGWLPQSQMNSEGVLAESYIMWWWGTAASNCIAWREKPTLNYQTNCNGGIYWKQARCIADYDY